MASLGKKKGAKKPRPVAGGKDPAPRGAHGLLNLRAIRDGELVELDDAPYMFVGRLTNGVLAFAPVLEPDDHPVYLRDDEVVSFRSER